MANEAVIIELNNNNSIRFTTAEEGTIVKGTLCQLTSPRTASATSGLKPMVAGIAAATEVSGATSVACYVPGQGNIFDLLCSGPVTAGQMVCLSGANAIVVAADADFEAGDVLGKALETIAGSTDETIAVLV